MSAIAVITARGGSKRIPRKNIKEFCGRPILTYPIEAALGSGLFDEVMVSTDDAEIAEVARAAGAAVPFLRSAETSDDYATTMDVLAEVLRAYEARERAFDLLCCLYPTAPFVTAEKLRRAAEALEASGADALVPVVAFSYPPQRSFSLTDGRLAYNFPQYVRTRSQDLPTWYHDAGQFYFYKVAELAADAVSGGYAIRAVPFVLDEMEVQDIDHLVDWELAEMKYQMMMKCARTRGGYKRPSLLESCAENSITTWAKTPSVIEGAFVVRGNSGEAGGRHAA